MRQNGTLTPHLVGGTLGARSVRPGDEPGNYAAGEAPQKDDGKPPGAQVSSLPMSKCALLVGLQAALLEIVAHKEGRGDVDSAGGAEWRSNDQRGA